MQAHEIETTTTVGAAEAAPVLETSFGNEQPVVTVPYSSLRRSPLNARTKPLSGISGLAANIRAKGLLQNLVVHEMKGTRAAGSASTASARVSAVRPRSTCCSSRSTSPPTIRCRCESSAKAKPSPFR